MSAPAAASASAMARPMPRRAPVTTASRPDRSKWVHDVSWQSMSTFMTLPPPRRRSNAAAALASGSTWDDQRAAGTLPARSRSMAVVVVVALVDAGADHGQLAPEEAENVDLARLAVDADDDQAAAHREQFHRRGDAGGRAGDLERHGRAGTAGPCLHVGCRGRRRRIEGPDAELLGDRSPLGVDLHEDHVRVDGAGHEGDQHADGTAADDDRLLAGAQAGPAYVVHGNRRRLDQRRVGERKVLGQRDDHIGRNSPALLHRAPSRCR